VRDRAGNRFAVAGGGGAETNPKRRRRALNLEAQLARLALQANKNQ